MRRSRLLFVVLVAGVCLFGVPLPVTARSSVPETVSRSMSFAAGASLKPTATRGAFLERGAKTFGIQANLVAVSFVSENDHEALEDDLLVEARFRTSDGWGSWERLFIEPEDAPDAGSSEARGGSQRTFAGPIWVGTADQMTLRLVSSPGGPAVSDVRVHAINTKGDARKPTIFHRAVGAISRMLRGNSEAYAMPATPSIITRRQWGANESWRECCLVYAPTIHMAFVHHTAGSNSYSRSESAAIVRSVYRFHTSNRGWADIGYNFLVDRYGQIFEGRYGGIERAVRGAHVAGFNYGSTGISLMGTFTTARPTSAMLSSLQRLLAWKMDVHHVPPVGTVRVVSGGNPKYREGVTVAFNRIAGHRDGQQTGCPGTEVYHRLSSIRSGANGIGHPKIYLPSISASNFLPAPDGSRTITVRATFSQTVNWTLTFRSAAGATLRVLTGRGTSVAAAWNGLTTAGTLPQTGTVRYTLEANAGPSYVARPVVDELFLLNTNWDRSGSPSAGSGGR